jgi:hypothetical protein
VDDLLRVNILTGFYQLVDVVSYLYLVQALPSAHKV